MSTSSLSTELDGVENPALLPAKVFKGHGKWVESVAYFSDGKRIVSGSWDKTIRIWDMDSDKQDGQSLEYDFKATCISISLDGQTLAVSGESRVVLWNLESRSVVWKNAEEVDVLRGAFSPDRQLIAATTEDIVLLDAETGQRIREPLQFGEQVMCLAFSPDGTRVAAGSGNARMRVFDVATGETVVNPINAHAAYVTSVVFTPDGKQIITSLRDGSIRVWDGSSGQEVGKPMLGHKPVNIEQIALAPDGRRLVSAAHDGTACVWNVSKRRQIGGSLQTQDSPAFTSVAWSPNGRFIVAGSSLGDISLWDVSSLAIENSDTAINPTLPFIQEAQPPVLGAGNNPLPSASRSRASLLSPSLLDLPAGTPIQPKSNHSDDFWDTSDLDLPARAGTQISTIPIAAVPFKRSIPRTSTAKAAPNASSAAPSADNNFLGRIGTRFRRDKHAPNPIGTQPPPPKTPKYSPVAKVALGQADARLYMDTSKDKKPGDDESVQEEWANVEVNCWDIFCAVFTSCCSSRGDSE